MRVDKIIAVKVGNKYLQMTPEGNHRLVERMTQATWWPIDYLAEVEEGMERVLDGKHYSIVETDY